MTFDLSSLDTRTLSESGSPMVIRHPSTLQPLIDPETKQPITITLKGRGSDAFREAQREAGARRAAFQARGIIQTPDDLDRETQEILCAATVTWSFTKLDGTDFPFSKENVRRLWSDRRWPWLNNQAINFITDDGNFLALSASA